MNIIFVTIMGMIWNALRNYCPTHSAMLLRNTRTEPFVHQRPWDGSALLQLQRQACTAPFYASEKLSPSIRCPTRPVRFPLPLLAAVGPLGVIFCWLSLQAWVRLCLTIKELHLCKRGRALMMSDNPAAENTPARPLTTVLGINSI